MLVNADIGERDFGNDVDVKILQHVDIANIALGAHAGSAEWSRELAGFAREAGVKVSLHPGYPDRDGFGRNELAMPWASLRKSLDEQRAVLPEIRCCKFHGAIYNRANVDDAFAQLLAEWCLASDVTELLAPAKSCLAVAATKRGIGVLREGFADRRYRLENGRLILVPRAEAGAAIQASEEMIAQVEEMHLRGRVRLLDGTFHLIQCDTVCVHGDSSTALEIVKRLREWKERI
jgi:UPF0271 protein